MVTGDLGHLGVPVVKIVVVGRKQDGKIVIIHRPLVMGNSAKVQIWLLEHATRKNVQLHHLFHKEVNTHLTFINIQHCSKYSK
jgi:hypothetical protein